MYTNKLPLAFSIFLLFSSLLFTSCSKKMLSVHTDIVNYTTLASYHVCTPDPHKNNPPFGQRLVLSWSIPKRMFSLTPYRVHLTVRYKNRQESTISLLLKKRSGTYIACILNEEYCKKGGIATYKATLLANEEVVEEVKQQLWKKYIEFVWE